MRLARTDSGPVTVFQASTTPGSEPAPPVYGVCFIPKPYSLVREDLDEHFQFPVVDAIEEVNGYFHDRLHELLEAS